MQAKELSNKILLLMLYIKMLHEMVFPFNHSWIVSLLVYIDQKPSSMKERAKNAFLGWEIKTPPIGIEVLFPVSPDGYTGTRAE